MSFTAIDAPCKLEKCPSCRQRPKLFKNVTRNPINFVTGIEYHVKCDNPNCKIQPQTYNCTDINNYNNSSIAINKACSIWNSRGSIK